METIANRVRVAAIHHPDGKIQPVWFDLNRRQYRIVEVTNTWRERRGEGLLIFFHVSDGGALYELIYSCLTAHWSLQQIEALIP